MYFLPGLLYESIRISRPAARVTEVFFNIFFHKSIGMRLSLLDHRGVTVIKSTYPFSTQLKKSKPRAKDFCGEEGRRTPILIGWPSLFSAFLTS